MLPLAILAFAVAQAPATDLDGSYDLKQIYEEGKFTPQDVLRNYQEATIANGELTIRSTTGNDVARFTLDPKAKIPQIDFLSPNAGDKTVSPGIYKLEKGELTIVFHKGGDPRPMDFKGDGKNVVKMILVKRVPKK
jgi:uncharacterized protein (TIGR03067 family)